MHGKKQRGNAHHRLKLKGQPFGFVEHQSKIAVETVEDQHNRYQNQGAVKGNSMFPQKPNVVDLHRVNTGGSIEDVVPNDAEVTHGVTPTVDEETGPQNQSVASGLVSFRDLVAEEQRVR